MTIPILTSIVAGYFMGNLMASYLVAKWVMGYDIRKHGTGNAGGSNSFLLMGFKNGFIVGIIDILKAFIAVYIIKILYPDNPQLPLLMIISGSMAVLGHIFPFFMGFKGGKGMACFMGMCLGINWPIGLYLVLITIILTAITDYVAIATIAAYLGIPLFMALAPDIFFGISGLEYSIGTVTVTLFIGLVGIWKHRGNISNLLNKKEKGLREALKKHS